MNKLIYIIIGTLFAGIITTIGFIGQDLYGRVQAMPSAYVEKDDFRDYKMDVCERLERIEKNQDKMYDMIQDIWVYLLDHPCQDCETAQAEVE